MWKRLNSNQMCEQFSYKEVFLIKKFLIERFYCIYIYIYINIYTIKICQASIYLYNLMFYPIVFSKYSYFHSNKYTTKYFSME